MAMNRKRKNINYAECDIDVSDCKTNREEYELVFDEPLKTYYGIEYEKGWRPNFDAMDASANDAARACQYFLIDIEKFRIIRESDGEERVIFGRMIEKDGVIVNGAVQLHEININEWIDALRTASNIEWLTQHGFITQRELNRRCLRVFKLPFSKDMEVWHKPMLYGAENAPFAKPVKVQIIEVQPNAFLGMRSPEIKFISSRQVSGGWAHAFQFMHSCDWDTSFSTGWKLNDITTEIEVYCARLALQTKNRWYFQENHCALRRNAYPSDLIRESAYYEKPKIYDSDRWNGTLDVEPPTHPWFRKHLLYQIKEVVGQTFSMKVDEKRVTSAVKDVLIRAMKRQLDAFALPIPEYEFDHVLVPFLEEKTIGNWQYENSKNIEFDLTLKQLKKIFGVDSMVYADIGGSEVKLVGNVTIKYIRDYSMLMVHRFSYKVKKIRNTVSTHEQTEANED